MKALAFADLDCEGLAQVLANKGIDVMEPDGHRYFAWPRQLGGGE